MPPFIISFVFTSFSKLLRPGYVWYAGEVIGSAVFNRHNRFLVKSATLDAIKKEVFCLNAFTPIRGPNIRVKNMPIL